MSDLKDSYIYCPVCGRILVADNITEVETGEHNQYVFVHDSVAHTDNDLKALENKLQ